MKDALNAAYPDSVVPDTLALRVAARLERSPRPTHSSRRRFIAPALALAALAGIGLYAAPRWLSPKPVYALEKMSKALRKIKTIHIKQYVGEHQLFSEEWHTGSRHRRDDCYTGTCKLTSVTVGTQSYGINSDKKLVVVSETEEMESIFPTLATIFKNQELSALGQDHVVYEGQQQLKERRVNVYKVTLPSGAYLMESSKKESAYFRIYLSPETDLPVRIEEHKTENGQWTSSYKDLEFDAPLSPEQFPTAFPGMTVVPVRTYENASFYKRFQQAGKKTQVGSHTFVVHELQVMEALGLVLWYSTNETGPLPTLQLHGKGHSCPVLSQGVVGEHDASLRERYTLEGKRLRWVYFQQTFVAPMGNGDWQLHITYPDAEQTQSLSISGFGGTLPSHEAGDEIGRAVPSLSGERARDRAEYFMDGRWRDDAPLVQSAMQDGFDPREGALGWLRLAVQEDKKWLPSAKHARDWRRLAEILDQLKRPEEAKTYREKADAER